MKHEIMNRGTGDVLFTADIEHDEDSPGSVKTGLAVKWAIKNDAGLRDADLRDACLLYTSPSPRDA